MNAVIRFLLLPAMAAMLFTCKSEDQRLSQAELDKIKKDYSAEAINYLYEIAYFQDYVGSKDHLTRWKTDIWIGLAGELWPNDSLYVNNAVEQINSLGLPVLMHFTSDTSKANLMVYFGNYKYLEKKLDTKNYVSFLGIGKISETASAVTSAKVGIANNAATYASLNSPDSSRMRQLIILEEIIQILGVTGDSWMNYNSIFFEGKREIQHIDETDKAIIKLLYEKSISPGYPRKQFENDFKDVLHHIDAKNKIIRYVSENKVPVSHLTYIRDNSFNGDKLFKYSKRVFVKIQGNPQKEDMEFCRKVIQEFNNITDQFQLEIAPDDIWHQYPCINIQYNDSTIESPIAERWFAPGKMMFARRVSGTIKISCRKPASLQEQKNKNILLIGAMFKILGLDHNNDNVAEIDASNTIRLKPVYKEILSLLYNPVIPDGFTLKEMDEVIDACK